MGGRKVREREDGVAVESVKKCCSGGRPAARLAGRCTGAGSRAITHNLAIDTAFNLARQDDMWYRVTAERIGNIGRLNVRKVSKHEVHI